MTTVRDVARRAEVSPATVSRVVSNRGYVSARTRAQVLQAISELQYVPNAMARGLKTQRSGLIVLLVPEILNSFYTTIARGVEDVAGVNGLHVILGNTDESVVKEKSYIDLMVANHVDGLILASAGHSPRHLKPLLDRNVPTVMIDRSVTGFSADVVRDDNLRGAVELTQHLLALGHRRIAFVNGDLGTSVAREREAGFRLALQQSGVSPDERLMSCGTWFISDAEERVERLVESRQSFDAIFAANYFLVIGSLRALRRHGLRVPEDVALVCFDDIEAASEIDPFLTVVDQPAYTMGRLAAQLLLERISGGYTGGPRDLVVSPRLIIRRSCGSHDSSPAPVAGRSSMHPEQQLPVAGQGDRVAVDEARKEVARSR